MQSGVCCTFFTNSCFRFHISLPLFSIIHIVGHIRLYFLRVASLNVLFLFKWKFDKELALQVEHANKYSVSFFRVPSGRFAFLSKIRFTSFTLCARSMHHKTEFVFIGNSSIRFFLHIEESTIKKATAVSLFDFLYNCGKQLCCRKKARKWSTRRRKQNCFFVSFLFDLQNFECKHKESGERRARAECALCTVSVYVHCQKLCQKINSFLYFHYLLLYGCFPTPISHYYIFTIDMKYPVVWIRFIYDSIVADVCHTIRKALLTSTQSNRVDRIDTI